MSVCLWDQLPELKWLTDWCKNNKIKQTKHYVHNDQQMENDTIPSKIPKTIPLAFSNNNNQYFLFNFLKFTQLLYLSTSVWAWHLLPGRGWQELHLMKSRLIQCTVVDVHNMAVVCRSSSQRLVVLPFTHTHSADNEWLYFSAKLLF